MTTAASDGADAAQRDRRLRREERREAACATGKANSQAAYLSSATRTTSPIPPRLRACMSEGPDREQDVGEAGGRAVAEERVRQRKEGEARGDDQDRRQVQPVGVEQVHPGQTDQQREGEVRDVEVPGDGDRGRLEVVPDRPIRIHSSLPNERRGHRARENEQAREGWGRAAAARRRLAGAAGGPAAAAHPPSLHRGAGGERRRRRRPAPLRGPPPPRQGVERPPRARSPGGQDEPGQARPIAREPA